MEKLFNKVSLIAASVGGFLSWILGGWDIMLKVLIGAVILDYISGLFKAAYLKQLSSEIGFKGILKKCMMFLVVALMVLIDMLFENALMKYFDISVTLPLRSVVIIFFISNEGLSLLENASVMLPIPQRIKDVLLQLRSVTDKTEKVKDKKESDKDD